MPSLLCPLLMVWGELYRLFFPIRVNLVVYCHAVSEVFSAFQYACKLFR